LPPSSVIPPNPDIQKTPWTDRVDPELPWPEYPRPQMVRERWENLNGYWEYAIAPKSAAQPSTFEGRILVPFPLESALSGVQRQLQPDECLWYHHTFRVPQAWDANRVLLHFGAVDWESIVWVNGIRVGKHQGGYDPFTFDITDALQENNNEIVVSVWDPSDSQPIQRGKQVLKPGFIWYTTISGIWQTVWLEPVPETYIASLKLTPDLDRQTLTLSAAVENPQPGHKLSAKVIADNKTVIEAQGDTSQPLHLLIENPKSWSPDSPYLYDLEIQLLQNGQPIDVVTSYFGMRKFSLERDGKGILRICLNHKPLFLYGPLDQGYWPDGLYTPPTDEAMRWEINFIKNVGFNMLRKHIKVEPARYYYHCDRAGVIVWQDMVSGGISPKPIWFVFAGLMKRMHDNHLYWRLGRGNPDNRMKFKDEYKQMIDALYNVVSIAIWSPFNEGWGQFNAAEIASWTKTYDPTRLVDHASGWFDQGVGDFRSEHIYFKPLPSPNIEETRGLVLSEFGGYSLNLPEHTWNSNKDFGYKKFGSIEALTEGYLHLLETELIPWIRSGCSAGVYTQTADVETEVNGFLTYDRQVVKMDLDRIREAHKQLYEENPP
jgi:beta-galactosidase/beta-glucuronidase